MLHTVSVKHEKSQLRAALGSNRLNRSEIALLCGLPANSQPIVISKGLKLVDGEQVPKKLLVHGGKGGPSGFDQDVVSSSKTLAFAPWPLNLWPLSLLWSWIARIFVWLGISKGTQPSRNIPSAPGAATKDSMPLGIGPGNHSCLAIDTLVVLSVDVDDANSMRSELEWSVSMCGSLRHAQQPESTPTTVQGRAVNVLLCNGKPGEVSLQVTLGGTLRRAQTYTYVWNFSDT